MPVIIGATIATDATTIAADVACHPAASTTVISMAPLGTAQR